MYQTFVILSVEIQNGKQENFGLKPNKTLHYSLSLFYPLKTI